MAALVSELLQKQTLAGLRPEAYEHPLDTAALNAVQNTPGLDKLIRRINEWGYERLLRVQLTGSYLRVNSDNFPNLHDLLHQACETLDLPHAPELYVAAGGNVNAFTAGVTKPLILLYAGAVDLLDRDELLFVIGHEVAHIKNGHVLYHQVADCLPVIGGVIGAATFRIGELVSAGMQFALLQWKRMSEFTADRAGLLACQDANAAITTMMKIAGLPQRYYNSINTEDFIDQARAFKEMDADKLNMLAKFFSNSVNTHPWTVLRANQLLEWIDSGGYEKVLSNPHKVPRERLLELQSYCTKCGRGRTGSEVFCPGCGARLVEDANAMK